MAQLLTIGAELAAAYQEPMAQPHLRKRLACDTQIALSLAASFTAPDLLQVAPDALLALSTEGET